MISRHALVLVMICGAARAVHAQTDTKPAPPTQSQAQLEQVRAALQAIDVPPQTDAGKRISTLKDHFADLAASYLVPLSRPVDAAGAAPTAVGTAGLAPADGAWRAKYRTVESDLAALIGPSDSASKDTAIVPLDPGVRRQLEGIRARLQEFYAGTLSEPGANPVAHTGAPPAAGAETPAIAAPIAPTSAAPLIQSPVSPPSPSAAPAAVPGTSPVVDRDLGTSIALLDRIQRILDDATKDPMGKVSIDRAAIDEIRADVAQIKTTLQARQQ